MSWSSGYNGGPGPLLKSLLLPTIQKMYMTCWFGRCNRGLTVKFRSASIMFLAMVVLALPGLCQAAPSAATGRPIVIGERFQLQSEATGETRTYLVHRPPDYDLSNARYPLLIVLDGDDDFQHASTTADLLADANRIPAMLVVGIPNTDRNRDLIPLTPQSRSENFLKFITTELIPKLDHDFRTSSYRILVGHSNGGLFGLYALVKAPGVFAGYILASPALGARDHQLLKAVDSFIQENKDVAGSMYLTLANEADLLSENWELSSYLQNQASRDPHWSFAFRRYPEETHGTVPLRSVYDGLEFIFDGWAVPDVSALFDQGGVSAIEKHYTALSSRLGFTVPVPAEVLLSPAFTLYRQKRVDEAEQVILRTLELYPNDTNALLTAGRLNFDKGNRAKAIEYLKKALLVSPPRRAIGVDYAALNLDPNAVVPAAQVSAEDLQKVAGAYGASTPALTIVRRGGNLFAVIDAHENELTALSASRFYFNDGDDVISFSRDSRGRVVGLRLERRGVVLARIK